MKQAPTELQEELQKVKDKVSKALHRQFNENKPSSRLWSGSRQEMVKPKADEVSEIFSEGMGVMSPERSGSRRSTRQINPKRFEKTETLTNCRSFEPKGIQIVNT